MQGRAALVSPTGHNVRGTHHKVMPLVVTASVSFEWILQNLRRFLRLMW